MLNLSQVYSQIHDVHNVHTYTCDVHTHIIMCKVVNTRIFILFLIRICVQTRCVYILEVCMYVRVHTFMYMCINTFMYMYLHTMYIVSNIHVMHFIHMCTCIRTCISSMCMDHFILYVHLYMYTMYMYFWNGLHCKMCLSSILSYIVFSF